MEREEQIAADARDVGFPLTGCASLAALPRSSFFRDWLDQGRAGEMRYLERAPERRLDPRLAWPRARGVITLAFPYRPPPPPPADWQRTLRGRIAAYAAGTDYHDTV